MTQAQCISLLRELRGLDRVIAAVQAMMRQPGAAREWQYASVALDDRRRWLDYCLSLEHRTLIDSAEELLDVEPVPTVVKASLQPVLDVPPGSRIH